MGHGAVAVWTRRISEIRTPVDQVMQSLADFGHHWLAMDAITRFWYQKRMSRPPRPPCACTRAVPASLCPVLCVCLYCGRQKHAMAVSRAILLLCQRDGSALLLRLYALSKPSRPASRGGSPLRQDLAAPVRPKGSPPGRPWRGVLLRPDDGAPRPEQQRAAIVSEQRGAARR